MAAPTSVPAGAGKEAKIGTVSRNKPKFLRKDYHKHHKLGKSIKSKRKWRAAKGRQNKIRLGVKGHQARPKVGWSADAKIRGNVAGMEAVRVENVKQLESLKKNQGIIVGNVGKKKREEIVKKAGEMKVKILNRYKTKTEAQDSAQSAPNAEGAKCN